MFDGPAADAVTDGPDARGRAWELAPAKVNLFLHVTGRRGDGYHLLDSLVVFAGVGDVLSARVADAFSLHVSGPFASALADEPHNLVLRAARLLAGEDAPGAVRPGRTAPGADLRLDKRLPVASGIGGGSADAAAALRLLIRLWALDMPPARLGALGLKLGADVPVCLGARPARMAGVGEALAGAPSLPDCGLVLLNPGVAVATPAVFAARDAGFSPPARLPGGWRDAADMAGWLVEVRNDLEPPALRLAPPIADCLAALRAQPDCLVARMSGSGATCFGLFRTPAAAATAAARVRQPGWWSWGGGLHAGATGVADPPGAT